MSSAIETLHATLMEKEAELEALNEEVQAFRTVIAHFEKHPEASVGPFTPRAEAVNVVFQILENAGKPLHYRDDLYPLLVERGIQVNGRDPARNMAAYLSGDKEGRFYSQGDGRWQLKAWKNRNMLVNNGRFLPQ